MARDTASSSSHGVKNFPAHGLLFLSSSVWKARSLLLLPSGKSCLRRSFTKNPFPFFRQATQPIAPAPSPRHAPAACSAALPPTLPPLRLLRRLATRRPPPPLVSPLLFLRTRRSRGKDPLFCKARDFPTPAAVLMSWRELGLDLEAWKILELLVLELLIHQFLLQTPSGCCGIRRRGGRRPRHGEDEDLLQPHATAPCSSCRCHFPPRAGGLMMEDPPSSLHRRRCCRICSAPAARSPTVAQRLEEDLVQRNGVRVRMLLPLISEAAKEAGGSHGVVPAEAEEEAGRSRGQSIRSRGNNRGGRRHSSCEQVGGGGQRKRTGQSKRTSGSSGRDSCTPSFQRVASPVPH
ncbi:uncharacterized protein [Triticum aestivum]|uniref:uncharacterized protein isoform X2 n=1 Tax=Triticum aestivum TaxID=4565 RepID=UPI001D029386|nr:uncharacterized protein LOC123054540 isoform X2 [Triticum aestivum]